MLLKIFLSIGKGVDNFGESIAEEYGIIPAQRKTGGKEETDSVGTPDGTRRLVFLGDGRTLALFAVDLIEDEFLHGRLDRLVLFRRPGERLAAGSPIGIEIDHHMFFLFGRFRDGAGGFLTYSKETHQHL